MTWSKKFFRLPFVAFPLAQTIIDVQHPGSIENVRRRFHLVPSLDLPIIISFQLCTPHADSVCLRILRRDGTAAGLTAKALFPRSRRIDEPVEKRFVRGSMSPCEVRRIIMDRMDERTCYDQGISGTKLSSVIRAMRTIQPLALSAVTKRTCYRRCGNLIRNCTAVAASFQRAFYRYRRRHDGRLEPKSSNTVQREPVIMGLVLTDSRVPV